MQKGAVQVPKRSSSEERRNSALREYLGKAASAGTAAPRCDRGKEGECSTEDGVD